MNTAMTAFIDRLPIKSVLLPAPHYFERANSTARPRLRTHGEAVRCGANAAPILLFGMPRSGTTWLGKLFDSHPDTLYRHEPDSVLPLANVPLTASPCDADRYRDYIYQYADNIAAMTLAKTSGQLPLFPKNYLARGAYSAQSAWVVAGKGAEQLFGQWPMLPFASKQALDRSRLVWKSIESVTRVGAVLNALPNARCIVIVRHPCGQIASRLTGGAAAKFDSAVSAEDDLGVLEALLRTDSAKRHRLTRGKLMALSAEERLAWSWVVSNEKALDDIAALGFGDRAQVLVYEQLCANPEGSLRRAFRFTGLSWEPQTAKFIAASTINHRRGYYSVFKNPSRAASAWKSTLTEQQIRRVTAVLNQSRLADYFPREQTAVG